MKNIINKIKNISLEQVNKNLIFVAILSLLFRTGSFTMSYIPQPFVLIVVLIVILTIIDIIKNNKIKEFLFSIPKNIRIALFCLVFSILIGWTLSILRGTPTTFNMILEFGSFVFSLSIFLLILFYTRNEEIYAKKLLYALLLPIFYIIFILFPGVAQHFNIASESAFLGFTYNPNIISKILLIPIIFFITNSLFESKNKLLKVGYIIISAALVALLVWTAARAALIALVMGVLLIWSIYSLHDFNWGKMMYNGIIIFTIIILGFAMTPNGGKQVITNKVLNPSNSNFVYFNLNDKTSQGIINKFETDKIINHTVIINVSKEPRFKNWPLYLSKIISNPFGYGPNTHMNIANIGEQVIGLGPHNTYLEIWLWGGILGLLSFIYILFSAFVSLKNKIQSNFEPIGVVLLGILFALSIAIFFNDSIQFYELWIILALSLRI